MPDDNHVEQSDPLPPSNAASRVRKRDLRMYDTEIE